MLQRCVLNFLGEDYNVDFDDALVTVWEASQAAGRVSIRKMSESLPSNTKSSSRSSIASFVSPASVQVTTSNSESNLLLKTTIAALSAKPLPLFVVPKLVASSSGLSSKSDLAADWEKLLVKCRAFLREVGPLSPRFEKLFGPLGTRTPRDSHLAVQDDNFRFGPRRLRQSLAILRK